MLNRSATGFQPTQGSRQCPKVHYVKVTCIQSRVIICKQSEEDEQVTGRPRRRRQGDRSIYPDNEQADDQKQDTYDFQEQVDKQVEQLRNQSETTSFAGLDTPDSIRGFSWDDLTSTTLSTRDLSFEAKITTKQPCRDLLINYKKAYGRANHGHGTIIHRRRGGGDKHPYRIIDFRRDKQMYTATVTQVEHDPWRTAKIARVEYEDGEERYILYPAGLRIGDTITSGPNASISPGNALPLYSIPLQTLVHNVEMYPGRDKYIARSAGMCCTIMGRRQMMWRGAQTDFTVLRLPSGEIRLVPSESYATIGKVGDSVRGYGTPLGKAGAKRRLGWRPRVRGTNMPGYAHRQGGGKDNQSRGFPKYDQGVKTRTTWLASWKLIVKRRRIGYGCDRVRGKRK